MMKYSSTPCSLRSQWSEGFWLRESVSKPTESLTQSKKETDKVN